MIYTGMRRGELLVLRWSDVDSGPLVVQRALSRRKTERREEGEPKPRSERRRIALSASVVESLRRHRVHQLEHRLATGAAYEDRGFVFANQTGGHLHLNMLYCRNSALIARAEVPVIRFHDLRHTSATLMLAAGMHGKIVPERRGHANIAMTLDLIYAHRPSLLDEVSRLLKELVAAEPTLILVRPELLSVLVNLFGKLGH